MIFGTTPESLKNFRGELITSISKENRVIALAERFEKDIDIFLKGVGAELQVYPLKRREKNPFSDIKFFLYILREIKKSKPDIIFSYTAKPIIWTGLASRILRKRNFFALVEGSGSALNPSSVRDEYLEKIVTFLYKISLNKAKSVVFLNRDNMSYFKSRKIVRNNCELVCGIGLDLSLFTQSEIPRTLETRFLMISRLLTDKGILEYYRAASLVKQVYPNTVFNLLGPEDLSSSSVPMSEVMRWNREKTVNYLGVTKDVRPIINSCSIYVLPSYHEGMPRTTMEAMATGRPILTTDVPGCRETVIEGENGFLVPKADAEALAERMIWFIENRDQWQKMGDRSRQIAEEKFDVHKVNAELMRIMGL